MARCTSPLLLLLVLFLLSSAAAVLTAATATTATATANTAAAAVPSYCAAGQAIPASPLPNCVWYVATRSCDVAAAMLPVPLPELRHACCQELRAVPRECRCRALRVMMRAPLVVGSRAADQRRCRAAQARFAPDVVAEAECGLLTVHGADFCNALDGE